ncbi:SigE family RNA polymerase sigma factor [Vallicoccus soli]|uniref:SigE family RNA polymerase sigma factor n=1 Tax=Vallicoccus soli TaxID=2339232 RepID=A0A3A3Z1C1_9ACTN|nr:SigE family RNA polymerase sigma factor [Vallicoccus soli]RJK94187.1 SigE family RNA polymerase sigma factor [Vallicoccus soli]
MDAAEFDAFYERWVRPLTGQLYAMTGDLAEAQDVVQEAFAKAWEHRARLDAEAAPQAWVRTVAWRLAVSRWRRTRNALTAWHRRADDQPVPPPSEDHAALAAALRLLPAEQRRAVVLHHLCDLSVEQVAAETGAPTGTVKARLSRGRAALAAHLAQDDGLGDDDALGGGPRGAGAGRGYGRAPQRAQRPGDRLRIDIDGDAVRTAQGAAAAGGAGR